MKDFDNAVSIKIREPFGGPELLKRKVKERRTAIFDRYLKNGATVTSSRQT